MAPAGQQPALHSLMRLQEYGGMVVLQPYGESGPQGQSLACDLQTGKLMFADNVDKMQTGFTTIYGIMGIAKLHTGSVLIAVTKRPSCVSSHRHQDVWQAPLEQQR